VTHRRRTGSRATSFVTLRDGEAVGVAVDAVVAVRSDLAEVAALPSPALPDYVTGVLDDAGTPLLTVALDVLLDSGCRDDRLVAGAARGNLDYT
jgi:hypothetical protein